MKEYPKKKSVSSIKKKLKKLCSEIVRKRDNWRVNLKMECLGRIMVNGILTTLFLI